MTRRAGKCFNMRDYHPTDVRYKGPSTAFVGSKNISQFAPKNDVSPAPAPSVTQERSLPKANLTAAKLIFGVPLVLVYWCFKKFGHVIAAIGLYAILSSAHFLDAILMTALL